MQQAEKGIPICIEGPAQRTTHKLQSEPFSVGGRIICFCQRTIEGDEATGDAATDAATGDATSDQATGDATTDEATGDATTDLDEATGDATAGLDAASDSLITSEFATECPTFNRKQKRR